MARKSEKTVEKIENPDESKGSVSQQAQQLKDLIARGKEQGYLTYSEVNDHMPNDIVDPEQIDDIVNLSHLVLKEMERKRIAYMHKQ